MGWRKRSFTTAERKEHFEVFARRNGYIGHDPSATRLTGHYLMLALARVSSVRVRTWNGIRKRLRSSRFRPAHRTCSQQARLG